MPDEKGFFGEPCDVCGAPATEAHRPTRVAGATEDGFAINEYTGERFYYCDEHGTFEEEWERITGRKWDGN